MPKTKDYPNGLPIVNELRQGDLPPFPYITYYMYDDGESTTFSDIDDEILDVGIYLKAYGDNQNQVKNLGAWLRKVLLTKGATDDLMKHSIVAQRPGVLPNVNQYLNADWEFQSGADYRLQVQDNFKDKTEEE
ncbi:hypothetical protein M8332_06880 (plasmid) [Fructilactobacillus ixorae]|uniref:Uncharacterized protein n=1 Tax=Fructilactobacillus ixorae TaxID=1750535 RepID=A0ABY5C7C3_9LACO|nr:hypothetical protein [Fructilactobacillus ixorae]USS94005.1 hypothetical protein M8332_06880 [Fructilactobacillus ixorae]